MPEKDTPPKRRQPGPVAERLKINLPFEEAVRRALRAGKPPADTPKDGKPRDKRA